MGLSRHREESGEQGTRRVVKLEYQRVVAVAGHVDERRVVAGQPAAFGPNRTTLSRSRGPFS
jgi:hypothetical protein